MGLRAVAEGGGQVVAPLAAEALVWLDPFGAEEHRPVSSRGRRHRTASNCCLTSRGESRRVLPPRGTSQRVVESRIGVPTGSDHALSQPNGANFP